MKDKNVTKRFRNRTSKGKSQIVLSLTLFPLLMYAWRAQKNFSRDNDSATTKVPSAFRRPCQSREPCGPIPHKLWFTYKDNLLETEEPRNYYKNVLKTIDTYSSFWNMTSTRSTATRSRPTEVYFLDNANCSDFLKQVRPVLAEAFENETRGDFKADLCRVAALYLHGGYYFDVDMEVVQPLNLPDSISFSTSKSGSSSNNFFNSFMASTARHAILNATLESFYQYYILKTGFCRKNVQTVLGCCTLWNGYQLTPPRKRGVNFIMEETHLSKERYARVRSRGFEDPGCDYIVQDRETRTVYFYSRIIDSQHCRRFYRATRDAVIVLVAVGIIIMCLAYHKYKAPPCSLRSQWLSHILRSTN